VIARIVQTARGPVEVAEAGEGPAVLVVHGLPGNWRQGRTVADDLGDRARVLLVTRPGYGTPLRSGRTPSDQAALYAALLDALGIDRAVVVGISGGGPSSYAFAAGFPQRCAGLLLCCALAPGVMTPPTAMRRLAQVPGVWRTLAAVARGVTRLTGPRATNPSGLTETERPLLTQPQPAADLRAFERDRVGALRGAGLRNDTRHLMREIAVPTGSSVPTVVLHGDTDEVVPLEHARTYARLIPGARLEVLADHGHAVPLFARARVEQLVDELLRGAPALPTPGTATAPAAPPP
jgi:pimeloyl-ACP methyl ester carboxylesterase